MKNKIKYYFSLVKFAHTVFALPFALLGFFMAIKIYEYDLDPKVLLFIILCMVFARNAAMAFNRYLDRHFDKLNKRTANREMPLNIISPKASVFFTIANVALFIFITYHINMLSFHLSPVAVFVILFYSYTKRFTNLSHFVLGLALSIAPVGAFIAVTGSFEISVIILAIIVLLWTAGFDIIYSLQDEEFDRKNKLFSIPARYGRKKAIIISRLVHLVCAGVCFIFGLLINGNFLFWTAFACFNGLLIYQHIIIKPNDISKAKNFAMINGIASISFCLLTVLSFYFF